MSSPCCPDVFSRHNSQTIVTHHAAPIAWTVINVGVEKGEVAGTVRLKQLVTVNDSYARVSNYQRSSAFTGDVAKLLKMPVDQKWRRISKEAVLTAGGCGPSFAQATLSVHSCRYPCGIELSIRVVVTSILQCGRGPAWQPFKPVVNQRPEFFTSVFLSNRTLESFKA